MENKMSTAEIIKVINKIPYPKEAKIRKEKIEQFNNGFVGSRAEYIEGINKINIDSFNEYADIHAKYLKIEESYYEKIKENLCLKYKIPKKVCDIVWNKAYLNYHDYDIETIVDGFEDLMIFANKFVAGLKE